MYEEDNREVYAFGQNSYGELGLDDSRPRTVPSFVEYLTNKEVVQIAAGNEHTVISNFFHWICTKSLSQHFFTLLFYCGFISSSSSSSIC